MNKLTIDISGSCNIACEPCYQDLDGSRLSEATILGHVDSNPDAKIVEIGGGEPFIYKGITSLLKKIAMRGRQIHVSTNGTMIPPEMFTHAQSLKNYVQLQVSLFAATPQLYKEITGEDLLGAVIANTFRLKEHYQTTISSAIYKKNIREVPKLLDTAEFLQLPIRINLVFPVGNGKNVELLNTAEIDRLSGYLLSQKLSRKVPVDSPLLHDNNCTAITQTYGLEKKSNCPTDCFAKKYISPKNKIYACEFLMEDFK